MTKTPVQMAMVMTWPRRVETAVARAVMTMMAMERAIMASMI